MNLRQAKRDLKYKEYDELLGDGSGYDTIGRIGLCIEAYETYIRQLNITRERLVAEGLEQHKQATTAILNFHESNLRRE